VSSAAACVRHSAANCCRPLLFIIYLFIYLLLICYLVSAAAACVRHPAGHAIFVWLFIYLFIINLSFSARSGSMRQASCGSMMPAIVICYLFIYY
jgi:hypothetical protein